MKILFALPVLFALFPAAADVSAPPAGDHDWVVDAVHSAAMFKVMHANASNFYGGFDAISGTMTLDPAAPESGKIELTIPVESIHTRDEKRDGHLKGPDFFNAKENPDLTFHSTAIKKQGNDRYEVTGELEIAGSAQTVTAVVEKVGEGEFYGPRVGYETKFVIQRSKFGMNYGLAEKALGDDVTVMISLELVKPQKK